MGMDLRLIPEIYMAATAKAITTSARRERRISFRVFMIP
jgi:hypothetical protein